MRPTVTLDYEEFAQLRKLVEVLVETNPVHDGKCIFCGGREEHYYSRECGEERHQHHFDDCRWQWACDYLGERGGGE